MAISYDVTIAGVSKQIQPGWSIQKTANGKNTFSCSVVSLDASYRPALDDDVIMTESIPIVSSSVANPSVITTQVEHGLFTGQLITIANHSGSTPSINRLFSITVLSATTFSIPIQVTVGGTGGTVVKRIFGGTVSNLIESGLGGFGVTPIVTSITAIDYSAIVERRYINTVITGTYPGDRAHAFINLGSTNFVNNDTVVVGTKTYTMKSSLTNVDGYVLIGSTINGSLKNLEAAINLDPGAGSTYAAATTANGVAFAVTNSNWITISAITAGTAGNSIAISSSKGLVFGEGGIPTSYLASGIAGGGSSKTLKTVIAIFVDALSEDGITIHPDQVTGPAMPDLTYNYTKLSDALENLTVVSNGYVWEIDEYKHFRMFYPSTIVAPFSITDGSPKAEGDITVEPTRDSSYANRIILKYSDVAVRSWGFFSAWTNFPDAETVAVGGTTYRFKNSLASANDVKIGADANASIINLINAIVLGGSPGVDYHSSTVVNSSVEAWQIGTAVMRVRAINAGTSGNSIACTTSWADSAWVWEGSIPISQLRGGVDASLTNTTIANNTTEQQLHGIWESVIEAPDITDATIAATTASAYLNSSTIVPKTVNYDTRYIGALPGQTQSIQVTKRNINGTFTITDVNISHIIGDYIIQRITAIETLLVSSVSRWRDTYKQWSGESSGSQTISGSVSGSVGVVSGSAIYSFGGSDTNWKQNTVSDWISANSIQIRIDSAARGSVIGTCYVRLRARSGSVTARLRNVSSGTTVGTSSAVSSSSFTTVSFPVSLTPGAFIYEIQLLPSLADTDVQLGSAYFE